MKMPKKASKEQPFPTQDEARRINVLQEKLLSEFRTFGESLSTVRQRVDRMEPQIQQTNEKVIVIEAAVRSHSADLLFIKTDIAEIKNELKAQNQRLGAVETKTARNA
jgi:chromosome segregation ATPase